MTNDLLKACLRIRMVEEEIARRYPEGKMRTPVHLSVGQEAAAVGVCAALGPYDLVVSTHRSHAHYLAKGGSLNALIAELYGKATGCSGGWGGSMHLTDRSVGFVGSTSIVGGTIPVGVGLAWAKRLRGEPGTVVIFIGDACLETGVFHESANFAALHSLDVIFACENNGMSCYTPRGLRQSCDVFLKAEAHGLEWDQLPNDVEAVRSRVATELTYDGPYFFEILCKRYYEHCGVKREVSEPDYLDRFRYTECDSEDLIAIDEEIKAAFAAAEAAPWPDASEDMTYG